MQTKNEIRRLIKEKREALDKNKKIKLDLQIQSNILSNSKFIEAKKVLFYVSFKNEVDTINLIKQSFEQKEIFVPKVNEDELEIYRIESLDDLEEGAYGILEPSNKNQRAKFVEIDLALIPGVAFDLSGHRIGFGKGFYDKLNQNLTCLKVGLAYNFQIVDNIPAEKHDLPVDLIITENKIINI